MIIGGAGKFFDIDINTGLENWKLQADGRFVRSPAMADKKIFFGSGDKFIV